MKNGTKATKADLNQSYGRMSYRNFPSIFAGVGVGAVEGGGQGERAEEAKTEFEISEDQMEDLELSENEQRYRVIMWAIANARLTTCRNTQVNLLKTEIDQYDGQQ